MMGRMETTVRRVRRWVSRSEWAIKLFRLPVSEGTASTPGLVMIQVDGLSRPNLLGALRAARMPFLRRLVRDERYVVHAQYSGLPASTPAVQAELFYGVKGAVPAFSFLDRSCGCIFTMYDPKSAREVEQRLAAEGGPALLEGGSAYTDIFSGGAAESHFCASTIGWGTLLRAIKPIAVPLLLIIRLDIVVRVVVLMAVEAVLALIDVIRGTLGGKGLAQELLFVSTRVAICILLRELVVFGALIDVARGLPIVHVNFIGYDEQAHRRGPSSRFAQWTLRGIDSAISKLWFAAMRSVRRSYDVWIYSDHGQEDTIPYTKEHGRTVQEAVQQVLQAVDADGPVAGDDQTGVQAKRIAFLGGIFAWLTALARPKQPDPNRRLTVTAMGSLGHVYPSRALTGAERERVARALVEQAKIPMVLTADEPGHATAWTPQGIYKLPEEASQLLGAEHPYLPELADDLTDICHHPQAGTFVISGWRPGRRHQSFPKEFGSHTGPGIQETSAFALLPADAPLLPGRPRTYLRPWDLREGVHRQLGKTVVELSPRLRSPVEGPRRLRLLTYNVHGCIGMDGKVSPERIARVIARHSPDIVALQELDVNRPRSGHVNQPELIARKLGMQHFFQPAMRLAQGEYGNAIMSHHSMHLRRAGLLPRQGERPHYQPRAALWVQFDLEGHVLHVINAHLSLWPKERQLQAEALLQEEWLAAPQCDGPVVVCGDFNAWPNSPACRTLGRYLSDAQRLLDDHRPRHTWSGRYPMSRIDHVFVGPQVEVVSVEVLTTELEKLASDHLPLVVDVRVPMPADESCRRAVPLGPAGTAR